MFILQMKKMYYIFVLIVIGRILLDIIVLKMFKKKTIKQYNVFL